MDTLRQVIHENLEALKSVQWASKIAAPAPLSIENYKIIANHYEWPDDEMLDFARQQAKAWEILGPWDDKAEDMYASWVVILQQL